MKLLLLVLLNSLTLNAIAIENDSNEKLLNQFNKLIKISSPKKKYAKNSGEDVTDFSPLCISDEVVASHIDRTLIKNFYLAVISKNIEAIKGSLTDKSQLDLFSLKKIVSKIDDISVNNWKEIKKDQNKDEFINNFREYLNSFNKIHNFNFVIKKIHSSISERDKDLLPIKTNAEVFFELEGFLADSSRKVDRGYLNLELVLEKNSWKISKLSIVEMNSLQKAKPAFSEVTDTSGVGNIPSYLRTEAIRRGGYALTVGDFNNDGIKDYFIGAKGPASLFVGRENAQLKEVNIPGLVKSTFVKSAVWADFDNDGYQDLLVVRFVPSVKNNKKVPFKSIVHIYKNINGESFKEVSKISETENVDYAMPAAVADFNKDGLLDIYIGFPGHRDFTTFHKNDAGKESLKVQGIYFNNGDFNFSPHKMGADNSLQYERFTEDQKLYPHSSLAADFDQNGKVDLLVVDDRGNLSPLYINEGDGKFSKANNKLKILTQGYGMGAAIGDLNNDGLIDILSSNVQYDANKRLVNSCLSNWSFKLKNYQEGNQLVAHLAQMTNAGKEFSEQSSFLGLNEVGEGLAGIELIDYNNDGLEDIYIANGLWTGEDKYEDLSSELARTNYILFDTAQFMEARNDSQSFVMKLLSSYKTSLEKNKKKVFLSLAGHQRNKLFKNLGNNNFIEVGFLEGVDSIADGYVVSRVDVNNDGKLDLVLRNADPGSNAVKFNTVQVFLNQSNKNNFLRLKLVGKKSNKDAIGAEVMIETANGKNVKQVISNAGTVQSERELHFGLGNETSAKKVTIKWPSGNTKEILNLKSGKYELIED